MSDTRSLEMATSLVAFFRDELTLAMQETGTKTSEETEAYLVHLLEGYSRLNDQTAQDLGFDKPAAHILKEAMESAGDKRIEIYRRLGDASLYNCGFFAERLERRVGPGYYMQVGRTAYRSLSEMMMFKQPGGIFDQIFAELSQKFDDVVAAFRFLGGKSAPGSLDRALANWDGNENASTLLSAGLLASKDVGEA